MVIICIDLLECVAEGLVEDVHVVVVSVVLDIKHVQQTIALIPTHVLVTRYHFVCQPPNTGKRGRTAKKTNDDYALAFALTSRVATDVDTFPITSV